MISPMCVRGYGFAAALLIPASLVASFPLQAQVLRSKDHEFRVVKLVEGLEHPWGLAFLPDGRKLVTERPGRLRIVARDGKLEPQPVACQPGQIVNCPCDGSWSTQTCNAGGGFDPCVCGGANTNGGAGMGSAMDSSGPGKGSGNGRGSNAAPAGQAGNPAP